MKSARGIMPSYRNLGVQSPPNSCEGTNLEPSWNGFDWHYKCYPTRKQIHHHSDGLFLEVAEAAPLPDKSALGVANFIYSVSCILINI